MKKHYIGYSPKDDKSIVSALSKEISNGEDQLNDYKITDKIENYSKTRITWVKNRIAKEMAVQTVSA